VVAVVAVVAVDTGGKNLRQPGHNLPE